MGERETLRTAKSLHRAAYRLYQKRLAEKMHVCMWCLKGNLKREKSKVGVLEEESHQ